MNDNYMKGFIPYALAAFMVGMVGGFAAILGPAFVKDMGLAYNNTAWTALALATSSAACAPILGKLGDVIGRQSTLLLGIAIFALGNAMTALASSLMFMLVARFVVGIGTAAVAPVVMAYIITEFPADAAAKGFSLYMLISSAAVVLGPTAGGIIISAFGWRAMMWVCTAISVIVFLACLIFKDRGVSVRKPLKNFDMVGAVLVVIFFSLVLCIPSFGQNFGWSSSAFIVVCAMTLISFICLVYAEKKAVYPILPSAFMLRRVFIISVAALTLTQGLMQANMTNIIVFVNYTQPQNSVISGYSISIMYIGMSIGAVLLGPLADKIEPKLVLTGSFLLTAAGCGLMLLFTETASVLLLALSLGILGLGLGGNATIFMKVVLTGVPPEIAGAGTGTYGLFRDLTAPFGVAVFVPMFTNQITALLASGHSEASAATAAIRSLAITELICVGAGITIVLMLPKIYEQKGAEN